MTTEPTTTQQPAETPEQIVADGWRTHPAATTLERDGYSKELEHLTGEYQRITAELDQARRDLVIVADLRDGLRHGLSTVADAAGLPTASSAPLIATTVQELRRRHDRLVDELDVTRAARDRYQRATSTGYHWDKPGLPALFAQTAADGPAASGPDLSTVIAERIASAELAGPADTALARATIAVDTVLDALPADGYISDVDREDVAKAVLHALDEQPFDVAAFLANVKLSLASAVDDDERAEAVAMLLDGWYAAWPASAVTDPHQPLAEQLVRLLRPDATLIDRMRPVVDAAKTWRDTEGHIGVAEVVDALDAYTQGGTR